MKQFKKRIKSTTIFDLQERFEPIIENNFIYTHAMLLDPRFKDQLLTPDEKHTIHEKFSLQISAVHNEPASSNQQNENINISNNTSGEIVQL